VRNMERLQKKFDTARKIAPQPLRSPAQADALRRALFRLDQPVDDEALDHLKADGHHVMRLRVRASRSPSGRGFHHEHDKVFVVEQNATAASRHDL